MGSGTMFWRKKSLEEKVKEKKRKREVKKIEGALWGYMVSQQGVIVDTLQNLRRVERDAVVGDKTVGLTMIRIFDPADAKEKGVDVEDYRSLDGHPDLVLYEGYYQAAASKATNIYIKKK
jgi:hypothetical protein